MRLAIASGKGGTGKTLFSTSLARVWSQSNGLVTYVDADVEEPNGHLLLSPNLDEFVEVEVSVPQMQTVSCSRAGKCAEACAFDALVMGGRGPLIFPELCHSCGACVLVCPDNALHMVPRPIGRIESGRVPAEADADTDAVRAAAQPVTDGPEPSIADGAPRALRFAGGRLHVGETRSTPLIEALVDREHAGDVFVDCPPGASCSVMAALRTVDAVLLITESTPFGMHDLKVALDLCDALRLPAAVVINRADLGSVGPIEDLVRGRAPILATMPFDDAVQRSGARGLSALHESAALRGVLAELVPALRSWLANSTPTLTSPTPARGAQA